MSIYNLFGLDVQRLYIIPKLIAQRISPFYSGNALMWSLLIANVAQIDQTKALPTKALSFFFNKKLIFLVVDLLIQLCPNYDCVISQVVYFKLKICHMTLLCLLKTFHLYGNLIDLIVGFRLLKFVILMILIYQDNAKAPMIAILEKNVLTTHV